MQTQESIQDIERIQAHKLRLMILARLLYGKKIDLVIDGTIVDIANVNRARTQKIRRVRGKVWWAKRIGAFALCKV